MSRERDYDDGPSGRERNRGPADTLREGALKASIWRNEGEKGPYFTTTLAKTYEARNGKIKDAQSFSNSDLLKLSELTRRAYHRSNELYREARNEHGRMSRNNQREDRDRDQRGYREQRQSRGNQDRNHDRQDRY